MLIRLLTIGLYITISNTTHAALLDHVLYTSEGIDAECSDYLGPVHSDGPIYLKRFLISADSSKIECPLKSAKNINFEEGSVLSDGLYGCISAHSLVNERVGYSYFKSNSGSSDLELEMNDLAQKLLKGELGSRRVYLDLPSERSSGVIQITGKADEVLVVIVEGKNPVIEGLGVELVGGINESGIIWLFPNAQTLRIAFSGMDSTLLTKNIGMPGTFIAPHAEVSFQNALITGALFARSLKAPASSLDCNQLVSGQINPARIRLPSRRTGKPPHGGKG